MMPAATAPAPNSAATRSIAIFDLGGVLLDWNPRHLYRKLFPDDAPGMEAFLAEVCTQRWNEGQDAGRSFADGAALLKAAFPDKAELIDAYGARFAEMVAGPIQGTVDLLAELKARRVPLYALSNWSAETFPEARRRFDFLDWFDGIVISGEVGVIKPDPRIFRILIERHGFPAESAMFVDDSEPNVRAAAALGLHAIRFTDAAALRRECTAIGLL